MRDTIKANCHWVIAGYIKEQGYTRERNILGFVLDNGHIVPACDIRSTYPRDLRRQIDDSNIFAKFTLAYNLEDEMLPEIRTFDTIEEVKDFLALHK